MVAIMAELSQPPDTAMLHIENLHKSFGQLHAVRGLSLRVEAGEIYGFLGPNGAGKTTTLSMIAGLLVPDQGRIRLLDGLVPTDPQARFQLGLAPQALALYNGLSARENLRFFGQLFGLSGKTLASAMERVLALTHLDDRADDRVSAYSGGMKRRLNLAVALLHQPALLLLDEPTVGVDPQSRNLLLEAIEQLRDAGHAIVYTTHYMEEVERLADRIGIMDHGQLLAEGSLSELLQQHGGPYQVRWYHQGQWTHCETDNPAAWLQQQPFDPENDQVQIQPPDLEQVFLHLTGKQLRD